MAGSNSSLASAGNDGGGLEPWRELFRGRDIYDVIGKAIQIAATDSPQEFRRHRDGIVEQLFTAPGIPKNRQPGTAADDGSGIGSARHVSDKGSKVASCTGGAPPPGEPGHDGNEEEAGVGADDQLQQLGNGSGEDITDFGLGQIGMDWLQTLADEMDAEAQEINEVLRIKEILLKHHEQSADVLFDSLRRLQLMQLTADKIKSTEIGDAILPLRKHMIHKIRMLVCDIVKSWKTVFDDWILATKATLDGHSNESLDTLDALATEDEGGLAAPPMDVGAFFLDSQATAMQNVSEFLHGMDDDGIKSNMVNIMDEGVGCGTNSEYNVVKPSNSAPWREDPVIVQALPVRPGPPFVKRNPEKLPARQRTQLRNTNPQSLLDDSGNVSETQGQQSALRTKQEPGLQQVVSPQKTQEPGSRLPRIRIKIRCSSTGHAPRRPSEETLEKKHTAHNQGTVTVTGNPPVAMREPTSSQVPKKTCEKNPITVTDIGNPTVVAKMPSSGQVLKPCDERNQGTVTDTAENPSFVVTEQPSRQVLKTGMSTQSSVDPKFGIGNRKVQLANMNLDETKRKLHGAYQEAKNEKKKRAIQVVELCDVVKSQNIRRTTPLTKSENPISRTHLMKPKNQISRTPTAMKQKSHTIRSWEHDPCE